MATEEYLMRNIGGGSRTDATSKMARFEIIVNGWKPLNFIAKCSIVDVAAVLDPPLNMVKQSIKQQPEKKNVKEKIFWRVVISKKKSIKSAKEWKEVKLYICWSMAKTVPNRNLELNLLLIALEKLHGSHQNLVGQNWCKNGCKWVY